MLCSCSVQEAHDFAAWSPTPPRSRSRVPFLHFFDGFRTSHEVNRIQLLGDDDLRALVREEDIARPPRPGPGPGPARCCGAVPRTRTSSSRPGRPPTRSTPPCPASSQEIFAELADRTGRRYGLVDYPGHPDAERVLVLMGSGAGAAAETVDAMVADGERVGLLTVRLYRPFPAEALAAALPASVRRLAVLDRTKEPGSVGEPLYLDVVAALVEAQAAGGGRRCPPWSVPATASASKEFTPADGQGPSSTSWAVTRRRRHVTVGIVDDVTGLSVAPDAGFSVTRRARSGRCSTASGATAPSGPTRPP